MSLERLIGKVTAIANRAAARKASDLAGSIDLPPGIVVEQSGQEITLIGRQIRRRFITDASFRRTLR